MVDHKAELSLRYFLQQKSEIISFLVREIEVYC